MKSLWKKCICSLKNQDGVALVVVIMVFVVMTILGTSAVSMVYSDNVFSTHQEYTKMAQYAARSAVTVVEEAVKQKLDY